MLKEQSLAAIRLFADPVGDGGNFQNRINLNVYAGELAEGFES
jgi:hypothetical protein